MARIEGVHYKDGKPAPGEILLSYQESHELNEKANIVQAGTDGRFVFESVHPEEVTVGRYVTMKQRTKESSRNFQMGSHTRTVFPKAGETLQVEIGKGGRKLSGKLVAKVESDIEVGWQAGSTRYLHSNVEWPSPPEGLEQEEKRAWWEKFQVSDEGKALRASSTMIIAEVEEDGRFSVSDVPPGDYTLWIEVGDASATQLGMGIGQASREVIVPDDDAVDPIDLGTLEVKIYKQLKVGDVAPAFDVPTLDGKSLKLSDLAGKYVLLDFWATWCGPCVGEIPNMKEVYDEFKDSSDFAMVALSLDGEEDTVKKFVAKEGLGWTQGFLGEWSKATLPDDYGVRGIPHIFLIGPDGKIVATDMRGESIKSAVAKALGK
jgi:peroxiredoxin